MSLCVQMSNVKFDDWMIRVDQYCVLCCNILQVLQSPHLNLQLTPAVLAHLQQLITPNQAGLIAYAEFASRSTDYIAALYANQPPAESHWVELVTADGIVAVNYNKQTGEAM